MFVWFQPLTRVQWKVHCVWNEPVCTKCWSKAPNKSLKMLAEWPHSKAGPKGFRLTLLDSLASFCCNRSRKWWEKLGEKWKRRVCVCKGGGASWLCFTNCHFWKLSHLAVSPDYSVSEVHFMHLGSTSENCLMMSWEVWLGRSFRKIIKPVHCKVPSHEAPLLLYEKWLPYLLNDSVIFFLSPLLSIHSCRFVSPSLLSCEVKSDISIQMVPTNLLLSHTRNDQMIHKNILKITYSAAYISASPPGRYQKVRRRQGDGETEREREGGEGAVVR